MKAIPKSAFASFRYLSVFTNTAQYFSARLRSTAMLIYSNYLSVSLFVRLPVCHTDALVLRYKDRKQSKLSFLTPEHLMKCLSTNVYLFGIRKVHGFNNESHVDAEEGHRHVMYA